MKPLMYLVLAIAFTASTGCAKTVVKSDHDPSVNLSLVQNVIVKKFGPDGRAIDRLIVNKLQEFGFDATADTGGAIPDNLDAVVTYKDRWMWDITNYLLMFKVQFRDATNNILVARGQSVRTSLARKSVQVMVQEALIGLFRTEAEEV